MPPDYRFDEQAALITGGERGLGQAFAEALARVGATVAIVARSDVQLQDAVLPGTYLQQKRPRSC